jgi:hypothetical protein
MNLWLRGDVSLARGSVRDVVCLSYVSCERPIAPRQPHADLQFARAPDVGRVWTSGRFV